MMFDWSDQDQVGETIWGEFGETEDHTVPYPKNSEEHQVLTFDACSMKWRKDDTNTIGQSTEQSSGAKTDFPGCNLEKSFSHASENQSGLRLDTDTWPDILSLNAEFGTGEFSSLSNSRRSMDGGAVQLGGEPELTRNMHEDGENESFLDCDWASIADFDDLDRMFKNESIFQQNMVTDVDEFLSSSIDMIESTAQSIPMPDMPLNIEQPSDQSCSSFQLVDHSGGKRKAENRTADTVDTREHAFSQIPDRNQLSEKDSRKQKLLKSRKKAEERSKNKASSVLSRCWSQNISQNPMFTGQIIHPFAVTPSHALPSPALPEGIKNNDDAAPTGNIAHSGHIMYSQYGYPAYPFPGIPVLQQVQPDQKGMSDVHIDHNMYTDPQKYSHASNVVSEAQAKKPAMTPQEKIEKLRRHQQAQAMLAIQQQQQQFGHHVIGADNAASQDSIQRNKGLNLSLQDESSQGHSAMTNDYSLQKTIYYKLQDAIRKLDTGVRLCIRDSLFRLARSSVERQTASDRSSTNKSLRSDHEVPVNEEANSFKRPPGLPDAEKYTNPIDRTVAHLLFHRPSGSLSALAGDEIPGSSTLHNPVTKLHQDVPGSLMERESENVRDTNMQPAKSK